MSGGAGSGLGRGAKMGSATGRKRRRRDPRGGTNGSSGRGTTSSSGRSAGPGCGPRSSDEPFPEITRRRPAPAADRTTGAGQALRTVPAESRGSARVSPSSRATSFRMTALSHEISLATRWSEAHGMPCSNREVRMCGSAPRRYRHPCLQRIDGTSEPEPHRPAERQDMADIDPSLEGSIGGDPTLTTPIMSFHLRGWESADIGDATQDVLLSLVRFLRAFRRAGDDGLVAVIARRTVNRMRARSRRPTTAGARGRRDAR